MAASNSAATARVQTGPGRRNHSAAAMAVAPMITDQP